jgi:tetrahydromethanopterin S-methyltransferase subunit G
MLHCFGVEVSRHIGIAYGLLSYFHPIRGVSAIWNDGWGSEAYKKHNAQHIHKAIHHYSQTFLTSSLFSFHLQDPLNRIVVVPSLSMLEKGSFKVIIAGGGIAGFTLANSLSQAHIDYVLLEAQDEIAPQVGASIGILAQGGRILDQLGMYDDIFKLIEPIEYINQWYEGKVVDRTDAPQLFTVR